MTVRELQTLAQKTGITGIGVFFLEGIFQAVVQTREGSEFEHMDRSLEKAIRGAMEKAR